MNDVKIGGDFNNSIHHHYNEESLNEDKHVHVIEIGLISAILFAIIYIGFDNVNVFLHQFGADILDSSTLAKSLFLSNCILSALILIAGIIELNKSKEKFELYVPPPVSGARVLNALICIFIILQIYTSITNIFNYCILYILFILIDCCFRYLIANSVKESITKALKELSNDNISHQQIFFDRKYRILLELYVYHSRYPMLSVAIVRLGLSILSIALISYGDYTNNISLNNYAYINMIYCIIINEIFSWGYRAKMLIALRDNN
ncbi:MAG: hypothetical protein RLZ75_3126 [Pseudomonadota bacterium]